MVVTGPWPGIVVMSDTGRCVAVPQWPGAGCHYPHKIFTILNISAANIPSLYKVKIVLGKQVRITIHTVAQIPGMKYGSGRAMV